MVVSLHTCGYSLIQVILLITTGTTSTTWIAWRRLCARCAVTKRVIGRTSTSLNFTNLRSTTSDAPVKLCDFRSCIQSTVSDSVRPINAPANTLTVKYCFVGRFFTTFWCFKCFENLRFVRAENVSYRKCNWRAQFRPFFAITYLLTCIIQKLLTHKPYSQIIFHQPH